MDPDEVLDRLDVLHGALTDALEQVAGLRAAITGVDEPMAPEVLPTPGISEGARPEAATHISARRAQREAEKLAGFQS